MHVTEATLAASRHEGGLPFVGDICQSSMFICYEGAEGNVDDQILAALAVLSCRASVVAAPRLEAGPVCEGGERVQTAIAAHQDVAASTTISPVRTATGNVLFMAETDDAISSVASLNNYLGFIDEGSIRHRFPGPT
jgi:hypothetical protein